MYPGDKPQQKHNCVHVEIYDPTPEKPERCVGSRWNDGVVSVFDSYKFVPSPNAWTLQKIWFCSIDPWLNGVCVSHCAEHPWVVESCAVGKKSIFYDEADYDAG